MPYSTKRKSYKRKPKPTYKRKSKSTSRSRKSTSVYRRPKPTIQTGVLPFGLSYYAKFPFNQLSTLTSTADGLTVNRIYRLNSLYDPDFTGVGGQPYQYDQLTGIYKRYRVHGCLVNVLFTDPSADGLFVGIHFRQSTDPFTTSAKPYSYLKEIGTSFMKPLHNTGNQNTRFVKYVPINTIFGVSKSEVNIDAYYAAGVGANPINEAMLEVFALSSSGTITTMQCSVTLKFYCILDHRVVQTQS